MKPLTDEQEESREAVIEDLRAAIELSRQLGCAPKSWRN